MSGSKPRLQSAGFTVVELLVVISVLAIIGVAFLGVVTSYFVVINRTNKLTEMTVSSQNLLRSTVENIRLGDGVRQTNQITDANAPSGGWNTSNTNFVIIIAVPAINVAREYIVDPVTGSPYMNELVYYKSGTTLMLRKLAHPNAIGTTLMTSCPPASETPSCPADTELAEYVDSMIFALYDQDGAATTTPADARSVKITLNMQRNAPGVKPLQLTTNIHVTLRNRF